MDKDLVERIAREVIKRLGVETVGDCAGPAPASTTTAGGSLVVVVSGVAAGMEEAIEQIARARASYSGLTVFLTRCADQNASGAAVGAEFLRRLSPDRVLSEARGNGAEQALSGAAAVVYPNLTMTQAAKIGLLISDALSSSIAVQALIRRIPVVAATNAMLVSVSRGGHTPPQFQEIGTDNVARLRRAGVTACDVRELAGCLGRGASAPSSPLRPSAPVASSASIACAPLVESIQSFVTAELADDPTMAHAAARVKTAIDKCIAAGACRIGTTGEPDQAHGQDGIAQMIDHTLLKPNALPSEVEKLCMEARKFRFKSVCVNPGHVSLCKRLLQGSGVLVCTVVGFPLGATTTGAKAAETRDAIADGADEIDMVINIGQLKAGQYDKVKRDIEAVVEAAKGRTVKVILETNFLNDEEKVAGCQLSVAAGAHFVKTSTGFGGGGATAEDIALMRRVVGPNVGVKASGGVRTTADAKKMIAAGANRIGASASIEIATGKKSDSKGY